MLSHEFRVPGVAPGDGLGEVRDEAGSVRVRPFEAAVERDIHGLEGSYVKVVPTPREPVSAGGAERTRVRRVALEVSHDVVAWYEAVGRLVASPAWPPPTTATSTVSIGGAYSPSFPERPRSPGR